MLSRGIFFPPKKQFCWCDMKLWTALIITSWNFLKNLADFMKSIENLHCPYYGEVTIPKNKAVLLMWLENLHLSLLSRAEIFAKNKTVLMMSLENSIYPCYHEVICPRKWDHSYKFTWKLDLPLLSRAEIFTRIKQFCWFDLKIWHGPIIASWNFRKNIGAVLLKWFENSHCLYYHELKFSRK